LIEDWQYVLDERDAWSEHQPSARQENEFIAAHGIGEYQRWHLGIDDEDRCAPTVSSRLADAPVSGAETAAGNRPYSSGSPEFD
jgi:hypothetical protein